MPLDTRSKRASSVGMLLPFVLAPPLPDGTIDQGDRQHIAWTYSGILAGAVVITGFVALTLLERSTALTLKTRTPGLTLLTRSTALTLKDR